MSASIPEQIHPSERRHAVVQAAPTVVVLAALAGLGYWGHKHDWRAPKLSLLFGAAAVAETEAWCAEHNVPDSRCVKCHPELMGESAKAWCREHGVAESHCTICHPEILNTGVAGEWCKEHGLPEANCTLCHPDIAVRGEPPDSSDAPRVTGGAPESNAKDPATCQTHALRVQFASAEAVRKAGVELAPVIERPMRQYVAANAETQYERTHYAQVASRVPGIIWRVDKELGEPVRRGEVLALVDSAEVGRMKAEFFAAMAQRELRTQAFRRIEKLLPQGISSDAEMQERLAAQREGEIRVFNARQALMNAGLPPPADLDTMPTEAELNLLGLPHAMRATLGADAPSANLVPLVAPLDGVVIERDAVAGEVIPASKALFAIADTRRMWLTVDLPVADARRAAIGRSVRFQPDGTDEAVEGRIDWISTAIDDRTRTVQIRATLDNADGTLLAHAFGRAEISVRDTAAAVAVPNAAVQWEGCCHIVFVRVADDIFQTRKITLGAKDSAYTEVTAGVLPGEVVAATGSHVLKSEVLKSNLGAGCAGDD